MGWKISDETLGSLAWDFWCKDVTVNRDGYPRDRPLKFRPPSFSPKEEGYTKDSQRADEHQGHSQWGLFEEVVLKKKGNIVVDLDQKSKRLNVLVEVVHREPLWSLSVGHREDVSKPRIMGPREGHLILLFVTGSLRRMSRLKVKEPRRDDKD